MGRLIVTEYVSLDGVFEGPGGGDEFAHSGWTFRINRGDEGDTFKLDETRNTSALLFGRVTYEGMAAVWPHMTGEFADRWNSMPKFVVSSTLNEPDWNDSTVVDTDLAVSIPELLARFDGDVVVHGSGTLVRALLDLELVDELRLMTFPIVLGSGRQLFGASETPHRMHLRNVTTVGDGITITTFTPELTYQVHQTMPADLDTVWHAWTDPDEYGAWLGAVPGSVELDVRPGGEWRLTTTSTDTNGAEELGVRYVEVDPKRRLVMTTRFGESETAMEMTFEPDGDTTRVGISQASTSRSERDGGRDGSLMLLQWCADHVANRADRPGQGR